MENQTYVELLGGLTVPAEAYRLLFALEDRGFTLRVEGDRLRVTGSGDPKPILTDDDATQIRKWKAHLMALVTYQAPELGPWREEIDDQGKRHLIYERAN